jgi:hypothetical protein
MKITMLAAGALAVATLAPLPGFTQEEKTTETCQRSSQEHT